MPVDLLTPILVEQLRAVHFFNGRVVSAEDMTDEQNAQRVAHALLGNGLGDGVHRGLEVREADSGSTASAPLLTVKEGIAINPRGEMLVLPRDVDVRLVRPPAATFAAEAIDVFRACTPPQETPPLVDAAIYLLTIASSRAGEGTTPFGEFGSVRTSCNMRWIVDSVEFRLIELDFPDAEGGAAGRLRNAVAYACFGASARRRYAVDPFGDPPPVPALPGLTECDVPLAILQWKTTGVQFVDLWSVRRRCRSGSLAASDLAFSARAVAIAEAMRNQFDVQLEELRVKSTSPETLEARAHFRYLPSAALLPVSGPRHFSYPSFFSGKTCSLPRHIEAADVEAIFAESIHYPPVDLDDEEMVWIYFVHENREDFSPLLEVENDTFLTARSISLKTPSKISVGGKGSIRNAIVGAGSISTVPFFGGDLFGGGGDVVQYVLFTNANLPFFGNPRFNRSHFDFANFG